MKNPQIQISWQNGAPPPEVDEAALRLALSGFLIALGFASSGLSVLMADDEILRGFNAEYRGQDKPTDILSWSYLEHEGSPLKKPGIPPAELLGELAGAPPELLGELAVSLERVAVQAKENGWDLQTELLRLLAHGCTHLAGHGHQGEDEEREMRALEIALLDGAGLKGIYP